jgi:YgiT-type zinc finger domain-containing protein
MANYDVCSYCEGRVQERLVTKACWWGEQLIALVENVPAGVCEQCGERYYKAEVLKQIETILRERKDFRRVELPLAEYVPAEAAS